MATKTANGTETTENRDEQVEGVLLDAVTSMVKKLIARGKERGYITIDDFNQALPSTQVSSELIEDTMAMLNEAGINVVEAEDGAEEEVAEKKASEDEEGAEAELLRRALECIVTTRRASTSSIQRVLRLGYNRAARLMDELERRGCIGPANGAAPREILRTTLGDAPDGDVSDDL